MTALSNVERATAAFVIFGLLFDFALRGLDVTSRASYFHGAAEGWGHGARVDKGSLVTWIDEVAAIDLGGKAHAARINEIMNKSHFTKILAFMQIEWANNPNCPSARNSLRWAASRNVDAVTDTRLSMTTQ